MKVVHKIKPILSEEEKVYVKNLNKIRDVDGKNASQLTNFIQKYIDNNIIICASCVAQFKFAINVIKNFINKWKIDLEPLEEVDVDIDITNYHLGGAYWQFGEVKVKGKQESIKYYLENVK